MLHHITHSQIQDGLCGHVWPSLRVMQDYLMLRNHFGTTINWELIERKFRQNRAFCRLAAYLLLSEQELGLRVPISIQPLGLGMLSFCRVAALREAPILSEVDPQFVFLRRLIPAWRRVTSSVV